MSNSPSPFVSNVLKLTSGSVIAQGLGILVAPILTRLFAPEAFGVAALFTSIAAVVGVVACLRYELAIMLPKTDEEAANLLGLSVFFTFVISTITALIILLAGNFITALLDTPTLKPYLWMIPIAVFVNGLFLAFNYWNSRTKHFGKLSIARVVRSVTTQATRLGGGFAGFVSGGILIAGDVLGYLVSTTILCSQIWRDNRRLFKGNIRWARMVAGLKRYKKFPIYSIWSALLNTASQQLPILFLAYFFSPKIVGFFALGRQMLNLPINLIGQAIGQVFFQKAADAHHRTGDLPKVVEEVFKRLVSLGIFPLLLLTLIGKEVFSVMFGARWAEAGSYVQILALWTFLQFISSPISTLYVVFEKQGFGLFFDTLLFVTRATSLIIGGMSGDIRLTLFLFAGTGIGCYGFFCCWLTSSAGLPVLRVLSIIVRHTGYSIPLLMVTALTKWLFRVNEIGVLLVGLFCTIVYYLSVIRHDEELKKPVLMLFQRLGCIK